MAAHALARGEDWLRALDDGVSPLHLAESDMEGLASADASRDEVVDRVLVAQGGKGLTCSDTQPRRRGCVDRPLMQLALARVDGSGPQNRPPRQRVTSVA